MLRRGDEAPDMALSIFSLSDHSDADERRPPMRRPLFDVSSAVRASLLLLSSCLQLLGEARGEDASRHGKQADAEQRDNRPEHLAKHRDRVDIPVADGGQGCYPHHMEAGILENLSG